MALVSTIVKAVLLGVVNICAFLGNVSLFVVLLRKPALRTLSNMFLLNLAAADLLVSVVNMPMANATLVHGSWMFGEFVCTLTAFANLLSLVASVMSLAMVSVNRYHFVVKWRTYHLNFTKARCAVYVVCVWVFSGLMCLPPLFGWAEYRYNAGQSQCFVNWSSSASYTLFMVVICFLGPLSTMALLYCKVWKFNKASIQVVSSWNTAERGGKMSAQTPEGENSPQEDRGVIGIPKHDTDPNVGETSFGDRTERRSAFCVETDNPVPATEMQYQQNSKTRQTLPQQQERQRVEELQGEWKQTDQAEHIHQEDDNDPGQKQQPSREEHEELHTEGQYERRLRQQHHQHQQREQERGGSCPGVNCAGQHQSESRSNRPSQPKLTRVLIIVVLVFCICWGPYALTIVLEHFLPTELPTGVSFGVLLLGYANSACNVVIYISTCASIRKEYANLFTSWFWWASTRWIVGKASEPWAFAHSSKRKRVRKFWENYRKLALCDKWTDFSKKKKKKKKKERRKLYLLNRLRRTRPVTGQSKMRSTRPSLERRLLENRWARRGQYTRW